MFEQQERKNADRETIEKYARAYRDEKQPELRAEALEAFMVCSYPGDPQIIINDAISECEKLREAAWRALEKIRHPAVRNFALNNAFSLSIASCSTSSTYSHPP